MEEMYANVKLKETVWHENSLNATMQKESRSRNWRIHASFTQRALYVCIAIQRDAHRARYTQWAVESTVHAEEGRICEKYTVYPQQRIVRNITADSNILHAVEREDIWIFLFSRTKEIYIHTYSNAKSALENHRSNTTEWCISLIKFI